VRFALTTAAALASAGSGIRWLRVAQREHYQAGSVVRFARRWWLSSSLNRILLVLGLVGAIGVWWSLPLGWLILAVIVGPVGLSWRGTSSPLRWTARMRRVSALSAVFVVAGVAASTTTGHPGWSGAVAVAIPALVDLSLAVLAPVERLLGEHWVKLAGARLTSLGATVVAITGSYGKTTTKVYLHHLLAGRLSPVSTPASFNNRMGLARAINENLIPGSDVFVAEMGTYGKGEIAELCAFVPPDIAVITAIGPVHLERFGSEEAIVAAKREILADAPLAVLNVDHPLLANLADQEQEHRKVVRVSSTDADAEVSVVDGTLIIGGQTVGEVGAEVFGANLAIAAAVAAHLEVSGDEIAKRLSTLPGIPHRRQRSTSERGFVVIDDTYNSNPAGAGAALDLLCSLPVSGRRVVVTPGMVELGSRQFEENYVLGRAVGSRATDLVVVGKTNRRALLEGSAGGPAVVTVASSRQEAVEWVRSHLGPGDAVLYENDLPDHYP
jgi:UDP-N-acetylmuramoyl-tripeptide--D-alanyl-D-alanine ligase